MTSSETSTAGCSDVADVGETLTRPRLLARARQLPDGALAIILLVVPEADLKQTEHGLEPAGEGWFVLNVRDARWLDGHFGAYTRFEGESRFTKLGFNIGVLAPGQAACYYHGEGEQEDFLILQGECLLLIEGEERALRDDREQAASAHRIDRHVDARDHRPAAGRAHPRGQHADRRRLARAVGSEQAEHLARGDRERDPVDGVDRRLGVALDELGDLDGGVLGPSGRR